MYGIKRRGFAMILAIFVVLLVAMGGAVLLRNSATSTKSVGDNYLRAQAELLAQSATEYAVMRVQDFNQSGGNCLNRLNVTVNDASGNAMFDANVSISYAYRGLAPVSCDAWSVLATNTGEATRILVDTTVTTRTGTNLSTEPIRAHHRSWEEF